MQNRPKNRTVYDDCSATLTNCQTVTHELNYKLCSFFGRSSLGARSFPLTWLSSNSVSACDCQCSITRHYCVLLSTWLCSTINQKGIILLSLLFLWHIPPPAIRNAMMLELIRYNEITLTYHRTLDRSILHFYDVVQMRH